MSLGADATIAATASVNLAASESQIADVNAGAESTDYARLGVTSAIDANMQAQMRRSALAQADTLFSALA